MKNAQEEATRILKKIYKYKDDMTDAIDTQEYVLQKGLEKFIENSPLTKSPIRFYKTNKLVIRMGRKCNNGYSYIYVLFDGNNLFLQTEFNSKYGVAPIKVEDSIKGAYLSDSGEPYFLQNGYREENGYSEAKDVIDALTEFSDNIKDFLDVFFETVQNIK